VRGGRDGKTLREDHEKLKIDSIERLTCCYAHSEEMPSFHRRIYWLLPTASSAVAAGGGGGVGVDAAVDATTAATDVGIVCQVEAQPVQAHVAQGGVGHSLGVGALARAGNTNFVLVHYLDERHIVFDHNDASRLT